MPAAVSNISPCRRQARSQVGWRLMVASRAKTSCARSPPSAAGPSCFACDRNESIIPPAGAVGFTSPVVSIFVNPTQFAPGEDFSSYPRTLEEDRRQLGGLADLIFTPAVEEMYPEGSATTISLTGPATAGLEDRFRPTHFQGVATVVAKLLVQALPDFALFGEKDYQQLKVITRMVQDLHLPVRIIPGPT